VEALAQRFKIRGVEEEREIAFVRANVIDDAARCVFAALQTRSAERIRGENAAANCFPVGARNSGALRVRTASRLARVSGAEPFAAHELRAARFAARSLTRLSHATHSTERE